MSVLSLASGQSAYRGYEYFRDQKVLHIEKTADGTYTGVVAGSGGSRYSVTIDLLHPRSGQCTCPHAAGRRVVCKHMVALYFTAFPQEAREYITALEAYWAEEEKRKEIQEINEQRVMRAVQRMSKAEAQAALLQILFDGPEWQYSRFFEEYVRRDD